MSTSMQQLKVRVRPDQREWLDAQAESRGMTPSALVRAALDHFAEVMPPVTPTGDGVLAEALAAFDRATMSE